MMDWVNNVKKDRKRKASSEDDLPRKRGRPKKIVTSSSRYPPLTALKMPSVVSFSAPYGQLSFNVRTLASTDILRSRYQQYLLIAKDLNGKMSKIC